MKVGGLQMAVNGHGLTKAEGREGQPTTSEQLASMTLPIYGYVIDAFGPNRCMFESNFPVDKGGVGYGVLWNAFKRIANTLALSDKEKHAIFYGTAAAVYKLNVP